MNEDEFKYYADMIAHSFIRFRWDGVTKWNKKNLQAVISPRRWPRRQIDDFEVQEVLTYLGKEGLIRLVRDEDFYLEVLDPEEYLTRHPFDCGWSQRGESEVDYLIGMLARGFVRYQSEGSIRWSREDIEGAVNPRNHPPRRVSDEVVQQALSYLEMEGLIRLVRTEEVYLEVLDPKSYLTKHPEFR